MSALLTACAAGGGRGVGAGWGAGAPATADTAPSDRVVARVVNQRTLDMHVHVLAGATERHLGTVASFDTARWVIPATVLTGTGVIRFAADPVGSTETILSGEILVAPGDVVEWTIRRP